MTILTYDVLGRIETLMIKNNVGEVTKHIEMHYDLSGNKTQEIHFDNQSIVKVNQWSYDSFNRLISFTEAADTPYARLTRYSYNSLGQIEQIIKPNGVTINHTYSALGQLKDYYASDFSFKYHFIYDDQGLLVKIEDSIHHTYTNRKFNTFGQVIYEELGNGLHIKNSYDAIGRKINLVLPDSSSVSYHYDSLYLRKIERFSNAQELVYSHSYSQYDLRGKVVKASLIGAAGFLSLIYNENDLCTSISTPYWSQDIPSTGIDAFKNILALQGSDSQGPWHSAFTYNDRQELVKEAGSFEHLYTYDSHGNRLTTQDAIYTNDLLDQLHTQEEQASSISYAYDFNGNQIEKNNNTEKFTYQYDALDRLIAIEIEKTLSIQYVYDAFYRRLSKTISKWDIDSSRWIPFKSWRYLYDGDREIGAVDNQGNIIELRVLGAPLTGGNQHTEISSAIAHEIHGHPYAPIHDHRGNVCCLIDSKTGNVAESYRYSAFGNITIYSNLGSPLEKSEIHNPWLFSSKRYDKESGFIFYGKRYYDPHIGRWITKDPLGTFDDNNPYIFLHNNPVSHIDLYGLFSISTAWEEAKNMGYSFAEVLNNFKKNASYNTYMQEEWDQIAEQFFYKGFLQFSGYYSHLVDNGCTAYGEEMNDKVRITLVNGILNVRDDLDALLKLFSSSHGDIPIHYVFRPTEGWTKDLLTSALSKLGFTSIYAKLLAQTWKDMIHEMGGIEQGGKIIHYAHSIGATDTYVAKNLLTLEEQKMIHVISMGSPTMIPHDSGFASAINYVSKRDGVCLLDPVGYIMGYFYGNSKIELVGSLWGIPLVDHTLYTDSYGGVIKELGNYFLGSYK